MTAIGIVVRVDSLSGRVSTLDLVPSMVVGPVEVGDPAAGRALVDAMYPFVAALV